MNGTIIKYGLLFSLILLLGCSVNVSVPPVSQRDQTPQTVIKQKKTNMTSVRSSETFPIYIKKLVQQLSVSIARGESMTVAVKLRKEKCDVTAFPDQIEINLQSFLQQSPSFSLAIQQPNTILRSRYTFLEKEIQVSANLIKVGVKGSPEKVLSSAQVLIPKYVLNQKWFEESLESKFKQAFCQLSGESNFAFQQKRITLVHDLTFENTRLGSPMTRYLSERVKEHATRNRFKVLLPEEIQTLSRGGRKAFVSSAKKGVVGLPNHQNHGTPDIGADYEISGTLWDTSENVELKLYLTDAKTNEVIALANEILPKTMLPPNYAIVPDLQKSALVQTALFQQPVTASHIEIDLWSDHAGDLTLKEGEKLKLFYQVNQDCYFRLYYLNSEGGWMHLFPDHPSQKGILQANRVYEFPARDANWEFEITAPFGYELIVAYASTTPFPTIPSTLGSESGFYEFKMTTAELVNQLFPTQQSQGQSSITVTTLAR